MKYVSTIGLDLANHVFQVHGADIAGSPLFNRKLRRGEVLRFFEKTAFMSGWHGGMAVALTIGRARSRTSAMMCASFHQPTSNLFVKRGKTDAADAEAISEAVIRKTMRFVPIKTAEQQADAMVLKNAGSSGAAENAVGERLFTCTFG